MIPENRLSTVVVSAPYQQADSLNTENRVNAYEQGGIALNDASQGLLVKRWKVFYSTEDNGIYLSADGVSNTLVFTAANVRELDLAFDQNMRPFIAFVENGQAKYRWYDTQIAQNRITDLGVTDYSPRCCMDDKRGMQTSLGTNDIILAYMRGGALYCRQQRDRYEVEYLLHSNVNADFIRVGMNKISRLQFYFEGVLGG